MPTIERLREKLEAFLRPLYQDLDGVSRVDEAERIAAIARRLYNPPTPAEARAFELLLSFHLLGSWLDKVGHISRTVLTIDDLDEMELRRTAASIRRLESPATEVERAVAAAAMIDRAGVRGLAESFSSARREGRSIVDVAREALGETDVPEWMGDRAREELRRRRTARDQFCRQLLAETAQSIG